MKKKAIALTTCWVAFLLLAIGIFAVSCHRYNHGICPNCNTPYKETQGVSDGTSYTKYKCENCGRWGFVADWLK